MALEEFGDASVISPSVVFPAPRKPVMIVTGTLSSSVMTGWGARYAMRDLDEMVMRKPYVLKVRLT